MKEELDAVLKRIKSRKAAGLRETSPKIIKTRKFDVILFQLCNAVYKQNTIKKWMKGCVFPSSRKATFS